MLLAALVFKGGKLEITVRIVMIVSGVLSIAGLIGVPLADMHLRNIGILGDGDEVMPGTRGARTPAAQRFPSPAP